MSLSTAGNFVILSKQGINDVPSSTVTGDVGTSPATGAADHLSCSEVSGTIYSADAYGPNPCHVTDPNRLSVAVADMQAAYNDAASRSSPDFLNLGGGNIGGLTLVPGLYKWTGDVSISSDITLSGGPGDVWIFQVSGNLVVWNGVIVHVTGGEVGKNIFWQVAGQASFGANSEFYGVVLSQAGISMQTGAIIYGRLLTQGSVSLQGNVVTKPPV